MLPEFLMVIQSSKSSKSSGDIILDDQTMVVICIVLHHVVPLTFWMHGISMAAWVFTVPRAENANEAWWKRAGMWHTHCGQRLMGGTLAGESSALLSKRSWAAEVCPWYWCLCKFTHWPWLTRLATFSHYPKTRLYIYIHIYHSLSMQGGRTDSWCRKSWTTWDMNMKSWVMQKFCPSTAKSVNRFKKRYEKLHSDHKDG